MSQISHPRILQRYFSWLYAFWKFSRPHTIVGTSLSVLGLYLIALDGFSLFTYSLGSLVGALIACLCGNVYIVGLNQLEDVAIDQINKPHLPLACGEFSRSEGLAIVATTGCLALLLSLLQGPFLLATVGLSLIIGTAYSLPPIRLKRFPLWAAVCIFGVRGVIVNLGLFLHFGQVLNGLNRIPAEVWILTAFILGFTFAIALLKDIPDIDGDRRYHITTFTIRLGPTAVFNLARWVLTGCYLGVILIGSFWLGNVNPLFISTTHLLALGWLWQQSFQVNLKQAGVAVSAPDLKDNSAQADESMAVGIQGSVGVALPETTAEPRTLSTTSFYQFVWKLFFLEYLIFPAACLLS